MEFGMSRKIKPKEKYVHISKKEIWRNLDGKLTAPNIQPRALIHKRVYIYVCISSTLLLKV